MTVIKGAFKAFGGGFCGCLGAWAASLLIILSLGFIIGSVAGPIIGGVLPGIVSGLQGLPSGLMSPSPGGYGPGQPPSGSGPFQGPAGAPPAGTPLPPAEGVEGWEVWLSKAQDPQAERETTFAQTDTIFIFVSGPTGTATQFQLVLNSQTGSLAIPVPFRTSPDGNPVGCGAINANHDMPLGAYRLDVVVGQETMTSIEFAVD